MDKQIEKLETLIAKFERELKESPNKTAITQFHINVLKHRLGEMCKIYIDAEKSIDLMMKEVDKFIDEI